MFDFSENIWYNHTVITNKGRCDMKPLSKSQQKIFDYLKECAGEGRVPSVREICEETGLSSTSTVHHHLKALEEKGLISREHGVNRCIQINGMEKNTDVPVLGRVAAGYPILAVENIECYVPVPDSLKRGRELFALRVQGESMQECLKRRSKRPTQLWKDATSFQLRRRTLTNFLWFVLQVCLIRFITAEQAVTHQA